jgi:hypothetical protein
MNDNMENPLHPTRDKNCKRVMVYFSDGHKAEACSCSVAKCKVLYPDWNPTRIEEIKDEN